MLKSLRLINYKSHVDTVIEFDDPITWIIGRNQAGKSNVIKALDTLLFMGDFPVDSLRTGSIEGSLEATWEDGRSIKRTRNKSGQNIILTYPDGTTKEYGSTSNLKNIIPEFTGFKPVPLDINSKPEKIQLSHLQETMFMISGISNEGILRRVAAAVSGTGIETGKVNLERDLRSYDETIKGQEAVVRSIEHYLNRINHKAVQEIAEKIMDLDVMCRGTKQLIEWKDKAKEINKSLVILKRGENLKVPSLLDLEKKMNILKELKQYKKLSSETFSIAVDIQNVKAEISKIPKCDKCGQVMSV